MSACEIAYAQPKNERLEQSKKSESIKTSNTKSAKERLLFCKCTC